MLVFSLGVEENHTNFLKGAFLGKRGSISPVPRLRAFWPHTGPLLWIWSACPGKEEWHQHRKHSERVALIQGGPFRAWLHGLGAWRQFEESGCRHQLAYMSLLCDAGLLKASVGQRRHLAQGAEPRFHEGAGVHGQADGDQPIRHGGDTAGREGLPADLCESATWDLDKERKQSEEASTHVVGGLPLRCRRPLLTYSPQCCEQAMMLGHVKDQETRKESFLDFSKVRQIFKEVFEALEGTRN